MKLTASVVVIFVVAAVVVVVAAAVECRLVWIYLRIRVAYVSTSLNMMTKDCGGKSFKSMKALTQ